MVKSSKSQQEEDDYEELVARTDGSSLKGESTPKVDGNNSDQKANTPRSKHSATEQRRRSKINERFQILRDLIPQNDQKRDKASFLLEVIEYIQFLQEKLNGYEGSYQGWSQEPTKLIPWRNHRGPMENNIDPSQVVKNGSGRENNVITPTMLTNVENCNFSTGSEYKPMDPAIEAIRPNMPLQHNVYPQIGSGGMPSLTPQGFVSDSDNMASQIRPCTSDCAVPSNVPNEEEEISVESGADSISSAYSQGLLNTLTQALQSSGVDLSQADISVQIDIAKRRNRLDAAASSEKDHDKLFPINAMAHGVGCLYEDSDQARKRLKTENS